MSEDINNPPVGDPSQAENYIIQLVNLIDSDKLEVINTDLSHFDPSTMQDHYRTDLKDYQVEVSHSKNPDTAEDSYVILFNNLKQIKDGCSEKIILAYMYLTENQFLRFKTSAQGSLDRKKKAAEEKRLKEILSPIDQAIESIQKEVDLVPKSTDDIVADIASSDVPTLEEKQNSFTSNL